jgi:hypothetical protein
MLLSSAIVWFSSSVLTLPIGTTGGRPRQRLRAKPHTCGDSTAEGTPMQDLPERLAQLIGHQPTLLFSVLLVFLS